MPIPYQIEQYGPTPSPGARNTRTQLAQMEFSHNSRTWLEAGAMAVPGTFLSMVDTFAETFGVLEDNDMEDWLNKHVPTFGAYFEDNRSALGFTGDIVGSFIPGALAVKAVRAGGVFAKIAQRTLGKNARFITSTGKSNQVLFEEAFDRARVISQKGALDVAQDSTLRQLRRKAIGRSTADVLIENVAADAAIALSMHSSEFLFPDEASLMEHLAFFGGFNAAFTGVAAMAAKWTMNRGIQRIAGPLAEQAHNPGGMKLGDIQGNVAGQRSPAITLLGQHKEFLADQLTVARAASDSELAGAMTGAIDGVDQRLSGLFRDSFEDSPIPGVTKSERLGDSAGELGSLQAAIGKDPNALYGMSSLERLGDRDVLSIEISLTRKKREVDGQIAETEAELKRLLRSDRGRSSQDYKKRQRKLVKLHQERDQLERMTTLVVEQDGSVNSTSNRLSLYQDGDRKVGLTQGVGGALDTAIATVDDVTLTGTMDGDGIFMSVPSTVVSSRSTLKGFDSSGLEATMDEIAAAVSVELPKGLTRDGLAKRLSGLLGDSGLVAPPALQRFRERLPRQFTGYARNSKDSTVRMEPDDVYSTPVTVMRDQVWGTGKNEGELLYKPSTRQRVNSETFTAMSHAQQTAMWDIGHKLADRVGTNLDEMLPQGASVEGLHHTELDTLLELHRRHGTIILERLNVESVDDLVYRSLASKFEDFQLLRQRADDARLRGEGVPAEAQFHNMEKALNLPVGVHPITSLFEGSRVPGEVVPFDGIAKNMEEVKSAVRALVDVDEAAQIGGSAEYIGTMLRYNWDNKPVVSFLENVELHGAPTRDDVQQQVGTARGQMLNRLEQRKWDPETNPDGALIGPGVMEIATAMPEALAAAKEGIATLIEGTVMTGNVMSQFVQQRFRFRGQPGIPELDTIADVTQKRVDAEMKRLLQGGVDGINHQARFNQLLSLGATGDQTMFHTAQTAMRKGWELADDPVVTINQTTQETLYQFGLKDTDTNRRIWRETFGDEMPEVQDHRPVLMPDTGSRKPVTVSQVALDGIDSFSKMGNRLMNELNALRHARGQRPLAARRWHLPPEDFTKQHVVFLLDEKGKIVSAIGGPTRQEADRIARQEQAVAKKSGQYREIVTEANVERWHTAKGQAWFEMTDFSKPSQQTGSSKGRTGTQVIKTGPTIIQGMIESTLRQFHDIGREARATLFEPELQLMAMRKAAAGFSSKEETIWDGATNIILGTSNRRVDTVVGKSLAAVESGYDRLLQHAYDNWANLKPSRFGSREEYEGVQTRLAPEHNPFNDVNDYLERVHQVRVPGELRKHAALLNEVTTALTLRIMDVGMMVVNYASLGSTMPPVIRMLQQLPDETNAEWMRRNGAFGAKSPDGIAQFSPTKAIVSGVHFMWSPEGRAVAERARKAGLFEQFAAEQVELFAQTGQSKLGGEIRRWSDRLSKATDWSERQSRAITWMTFYNIGKKGLGLEDTAAMTFAHQQANNVIADFRPSNRPVIFQGAAGMPLGLFTTYMWNYFQRIYGMAEMGAYRGLATQYGLQTALFGAQSLPGYEQYVNYFMTNYDGRENVVDRLNRAIGPAATEMFLNGSISSLSGVNVSSRAATTLPGQLTDPGLDSIPGMRLAVRGYEVLQKSYDSVREQGRIDPHRMAEILAQSNVNKGVSNIIEWAQGYAIDRRGGTIEQDTRTTIGIGSRIAGFKPLYADKLRQENRRNRTTERVQNELKQRLGREMQSLARRGELDSDAMDTALSRYMRAGGSPENFKRWFGQQLVKGTTSKLDLEIAKAIQRNNDANRMARLMFLFAETPRPPVETQDW